MRPSALPLQSAAAVSSERPGAVVATSPAESPVATSTDVPSPSPNVNVPLRWTKSEMVSEKVVEAAITPVLKSSETGGTLIGEACVFRYVPLEPAFTVTVRFASPALSEPPKPTKLGSTIVPWKRSHACVPSVTTASPKLESVPWSPSGLSNALTPIRPVPLVPPTVSTFASVAVPLELPAYGIVRVCEAKS